MIRSTLLNDVGCWVGLTVSTHLLSTIYKQKPVGTRFVQMVSKNSRMGNSVGIGVYHLQNSFKFTEGVEWGNAKLVSVWKFRLGILDYLSRNPVFSGNVLFGKTKIGLPFTFQRNFRIFVVNGKQPSSTFDSRKL